MNEKELIGKIHSSMYHQIQTRGYAAPVEYVTVPDRFIPQGTVDEQMKMCEMDEESVAARVGRALGREPYADTRR